MRKPSFKKAQSHPIAINHPLSLSPSSCTAIVNAMEQHADTEKDRNLPETIRVSVGSAIVLGLLEGKLDAEPTTAYLMTYKTGKCTANCGFCPQARNSLSNAELLSRITWPTFSTKRVLKGIETAVDNTKIRRVCIQALNYPNVFAHLVALVKTIKQHAKVPISISVQPLNGENIRRLAEAGVNRIGIALDAATPELFDEVKGAAAGGPYTWESQLRQLQEAVEVFGKGNVSTHLIVGLGETEREAVRFIQECVDTGVLPSLFAFTPVRGTALEKKPQPKVESYRRIQLARYLVANGTARFEDMDFDGDGQIADFSVEKETLKQIVETGEPFLTSGCPDCNRPFYNEKPSGPIYNYPRSIRQEEITAIKHQLKFHYGDYVNFLS
jgi:biotin synthase-related radical SAM superfamily protein